MTSHIPDEGQVMARTYSLYADAAIFVFLTSIRDRDYLLYAMGGFDSELFRKECRGARKSKFFPSL